MSLPFKSRCVVPGSPGCDVRAPGSMFGAARACGGDASSGGHRWECDPGPAERPQPGGRMSVRKTGSGGPRGSFTPCRRWSSTPAPEVLPHPLGSDRTPTLCCCGRIAAASTLQGRASGRFPRQRSCRSPTRRSRRSPGRRSRRASPAISRPRPVDSWMSPAGLAGGPSRGTGALARRVAARVGRRRGEGGETAFALRPRTEACS